jgi:hypothetical protein
LKSHIIAAPVGRIIFCGPLPELHIISDGSCLSGMIGFVQLLNEQLRSAKFWIAAAQVSTAELQREKQRIRRAAI